MVTIEISSTDIKLMEIEEGRVIKWASLSLEPGMFEEEVISDPQALSVAVKQLMESSGIKARNIIASVSGLYSLSRIVTVPNPTGGPATQQAVLEAANEVMPLPEDELYLFWQAIDTIASGQQQVMVIGVPRDVIDSEMQALRAVDLNPRILDLKAMALIRAVHREQALILNIEPTSFDVVLIVNGVAEAMRTTAWQQDDLTVEEKAEHLAVALELTVGFYSSHHPASPLDPATPLFITGQMSGDLALMEKLQARVEYSTETLAPPLEYPAHLPVSQYAVNIGLALKGTAAARSLEQGSHSLSLPDINLLPQVYRPWKPSARQIYALCAIVAAAVLLFPMYQVTSDAMQKTAQLTTRYTAVNTLLEMRKTKIRSRQPLQKAINEYHTIVDMGGGFIKDISVINSLAEELGIQVGPISHGGGGISFSCQADSAHTFREYLAALKESDRFSSVSSPAYKHPDIKSSTLTLKPKPGE